MWSIVSSIHVTCTKTQCWHLFSQVISLPLPKAVIIGAWNWSRWWNIDEQPEGYKKAGRHKRRTSWQCSEMHTIPHRGPLNGKFLSAVLQWILWRLFSQISERLAVYLPDNQLFWPCEVWSEVFIFKATTSNNVSGLTDKSLLPPKTLNLYPSLNNFFKYFSLSNTHMNMWWLWWFKGSASIKKNVFWSCLHFLALWYLILFLALDINLCYFVARTGFQG